MVRGRGRGGDGAEGEGGLKRAITKRLKENKKEKSSLDPRRDVCC